MCIFFLYIHLITSSGMAIEKKWTNPWYYGKYWYASVHNMEVIRDLAMKYCLLCSKLANSIWSQWLSGKVQVLWCDNCDKYGQLALVREGIAFHQIVHVFATCMYHLWWNRTAVFIKICYMNYQMIWKPRCNYINHIFGHMMMDGSRHCRWI